MSSLLKRLSISRPSGVSDNDSSPRGMRGAPLLAVAALASLAALLVAPPQLFAQQAAAPASAGASSAADPTSAGSSGLSPGALAGGAASEALRRRVDELQSWVSEGKGQLSLSVLDLESGRALASSGQAQALNPASNMKVVTAAAALDLLGPDFNFRTGIYGELRGARAATLVLRGDGDPSLSMADVWRLASTLVELGLRRVDGDLLVDQSRFDDQYIPPAFEQQPNEWAYFRAPVSAIALEGNTVTLNVVPTAPGDPARVWFDPPGFVASSGKVMTEATGKGQSIQLKMLPQGNKLRAELGGHLASGLPRQRFVKRVDDPALFAAHALAHALRSLGVELKGGIKLGGASERHELVHWSSAPLGVLVQRLGKDSDNFYAEMLFKAIAAHAAPGTPSTFPAAAKQLSDWLSAAAPQARGTVIKNGSGLFDANRLSAECLTRVLQRAYRDPRLSAEFLAQLSIGGVDGTLRGRFTQQRATRVVRAKTGTLAKVVALSGYVLREGEAPIAYSILVNGIGDHGGARRRVDRVVDELVALSR